MEGKGTPKGEAEHSRLVGGRFNEQGNFQYEACIEQLQDEWISTLATRI